MMKNIISPKSSDWQTGDLKAKLQALVLEHHPDVAELDIEEFQIRHSWALSRDRVKVRCELRLRSGQYHITTRVVPFALPPETRIVYRDWTIIIKPTWYGFGYQFLGENSAVAGESSEDWGNAVPLENSISLVLLLFSF